MTAENAKTGLGVTYDVASEIGQRLRAARENQQKKTNAIASRIKVREQYLVAIESGKWDDLPRGLNGRGLVRNYARELAVPVPELEPSAMRSGANTNPYQDTVHPYEVTQLQNGATGGSHIQHETVRTIPRTPIFTDMNRTSQDARRPFRAIPKRAEESLDIVTPDLSHVLGISQETLAEMTAADTPAMMDDENEVRLPQVGPIEVSSEFPQKDTKKHEHVSPVVPQAAPVEMRAAEPRSFIKEHSAAEEEAPLPADLSHKTAVRSEPVSPVYTPPEPEAPVHQKAHTSQTQHTDHHTDHAQHVSAHVHPIAPAAPEASSSDTPPAKPGSAKNLLLAACLSLLVIGTGAWFVLKEERSAPQTANTSLPEDSVAKSQEQQAAQQDVITQPPPESAAVPAVQNGVAGAAAAVPVDAAKNQSEATAPAATQQQSPAAAAASPAPAENAVGIPAERTATLTILDDVDLKVVIDDKSFFSGTRTAGNLQLKFKHNAEIFVKDGSKVKLTYDGWDHGLLGHSGRRRRLVLTAQTY